MEKKLNQLSCIGLYNFLLFDTFQQTKRILDTGISVYYFYFLAQYTLYITEYRTKVTRYFAAFMTPITAVVVIAVALTIAGAVDPVKIAKPVHSRQSTLETFRLIVVEYVRVSLRADNLYPDSPFGYSWRLSIYQMFKKINIKILYATIAFGLCH